MQVGKFIKNKTIPLIHDSLKQSQIPREFIHHSCGVFDTNAFKIRNASDEYGRAVMPLAAMLMHDCCPNSEHWFMDGRFIVRASTNIPKGSIISISYTSSMLGTQTRQRHLSFTKLFQCQCTRCRDPTELGTYVSAVKCRACKIGLLLPDVGTTDWQCSKCSKLFTEEMVNTVVRASALTNDISDPDEILDRLEDVQRMVGIQHSSVLQLLVTLFRALVKEQMKGNISEDSAKFITNC